MKFLSDIDLELNELQDVVIEKLAVDPVVTTEGRLYYNTANHSLKINNGTVWDDMITSQDIPAGGYLPLSGGTMTGNIAMSGAQTVDGVDVSAIPSTYLPLAGGTIAGDLTLLGASVPKVLIYSAFGAESVGFNPGEWGQTAGVPFRFRACDNLHENDTLLEIGDTRPGDGLGAGQIKFMNHGKIALSDSLGTAPPAIYSRLGLDLQSATSRKNYTLENSLGGGVDLEIHGGLIITDELDVANYVQIGAPTGFLWGWNWTLPINSGTPGQFLQTDGTGVTSWVSQSTDADTVDSQHASSFPTISSGVVAPSSTPAKVGDIYVDTTGKKLYFATGTGSSADWTIAN
jgi:hypothetical protein